MVAEIDIRRLPDNAGFYLPSHILHRLRDDDSFVFMVTHLAYDDGIAVPDTNFVFPTQEAGACNFGVHKRGKILVADDWSKVGEGKYASVLYHKWQIAVGQVMLIKIYNPIILMPGDYGLPEGLNHE